MHTLIYALIAIITVHGSQTLDFTQKLADSIFSDQWKKDSSYFPHFSYPPITWSYEKGLFPSYVHINFHGNNIAAAGRNLYKFPDSNGFVSMFVLDALLESAELGLDIMKYKTDLETAVIAILTHRDKNQKASSPIFSFWNQILVNETFVNDPPNISIPLNEVGDGISLIEKGLNAIGLKDLAKEIEKIKLYPNMLLNVFQIPSDFDDSGCALALGARLRKSSLPSLSKIWNSEVSNFQFLIEASVKYAYRPFSNDDQNLIDPRTYFWIREFLQQEKGGNTDLALVTTWLQNIEESKSLGSKGIKSPFNVNNVDASVAANFLHGVIAETISNPDENLPILLSNSKFIIVIESTVKMLTWVLKSDSLTVGRPDLILLYYPPIYDFYYFVARIVSCLENSTIELPQIFKDIYNELSVAIRGAGTDQLLKRSQTVKESDGTESVFWDDFLGQVESKFEDRVFSSSVALNALIDAWTKDSNFSSSLHRELNFLPNTPSLVMATIKSGINFLQNFSTKMPEENAFFSASVKGVVALPFFYPTNYVFDLVTGKEIFCNQTISPTSTDIIPAVKGLMPDDEFNQKLHGSCFNHTVQIENPTSNCPSCIFPYWSSPTLTKSFKLLALIKFNNINNIVKKDEISIE